MAFVQLIVAAVALAAAFGSGWKVRDWAADTAAAKVEARHADQVADAERAARASTDAQREIESLRRKAVDKEIDHVRQDAAIDARRAAGLRTAADRLREHVTRLAASADQTCGDPAAAPGGPAAAGPGMVLADLYRGADGEAGELAEAFDRARRAGLTCQRIYDSLKD